VVPLIAGLRKIDEEDSSIQLKKNKTNIDNYGVEPTYCEAVRSPAPSIRGLSPNNLKSKNVRSGFAGLRASAVIFTCPEECSGTSACPEELAKFGRAIFRQP
jgi:hypothetical protein